MTVFGIEFADAICGECLDRIVSCDPRNMGWDEQTDAAWLVRWERYAENMSGVVVTTPEDDESSEGYFTRYGCPICRDGLGCTVYPVLIRCGFLKGAQNA